MMLGGVSEIGEVERPRLERRMALAGPLVSLLLALAFYGLFRLGRSAPPDVRFGLFYLAEVNLVIGAFNLLPAFPMDGGRVLRGLLVNRLGRVRATQLAVTVGKLFAVGMVLFGLLVGSWWLLLIALFLFFGGEVEKRAVQVRAALRGLRVADLFSRNLATVDSAGTAADAATAMLDARSESCVVLSEQSPIGMVTAAPLSNLPARERASTPVTRIMQGLSLVRTDDDLPSVLRMLDEERLESVVVTDGERLVGSLSRADIARGLQLRELAIGQT
jgi:CBS domain-containing protein